MGIVIQILRHLAVATANRPIDIQRPSPNNFGREPHMAAAEMGSRAPTLYIGPHRQELSPNRSRLFPGFRPLMDRPKHVLDYSKAS